MPPARLRLKVVKDAWLAASDAVPDAQPVVRMLDLSILPFTLYLRIDLPASYAHDAPTALHVIGRAPADDGAERFFGLVALPPAAGAPAGLQVRRLLLVLIADDVPLGPYRVALVQDRQHLCWADVQRRADQLRPISPVPLPAAPPSQPVLLSGTHKSGTTWLEKIMDAHPDFMVLHEANLFNIFDPPSLRELVQRRQEHFRDKNYIKWLNPGFDAEDFSRFLQIGIARDLMLRLGRGWGARFVADRTPGYSGLYEHLPRFWEELRIVHIVRHPLDVLVSRLFHEINVRRHAPPATDAAAPLLQALSARLESGEALAPGNFVSDADLEGEALGPLIQHWQRDQNRYRSAARANPRSLHLVRYEDLLADFAAESAKIFTFVGTESGRTDIDSIHDATRFARLSGGREAGQSDSRSFFRKGIAGDWRNVFSRHQAETLWSRLSETAAAFGYTID